MKKQDNLKAKTEDYVAVEQKTGGLVLPKKHAIAIFSLVFISFFFAIPHDQQLNFDSPFRALYGKNQKKNAEQSRIYLNDTDDTVEISENAGSEENYDDGDLPEHIFYDYRGIPAQSMLADSIGSDRQRFTSTDLQDKVAVIPNKDADKSSHDLITNIIQVNENAHDISNENIALHQNNEGKSFPDDGLVARDISNENIALHKETEGKVYPDDGLVARDIGNENIALHQNNEGKSFPDDGLIARDIAGENTNLATATDDTNKIAATVAKELTDPVKKQKAEPLPVYAGKWYQTTIKKGDTLYKIFNELDLSKNDLKLVVASNKKQAIKLVPGQSISFLVNKKHQLKEIAISTNSHNQVRLVKARDDKSFIQVREKFLAQFANAKKAKFQEIKNLPSYAQVLKARKLEDEKKAKLELARKEADEQKQKLATRPRGVVAAITKDGFDKSAKRAGISSKEIALIKSSFKKVNFKRLQAGDSLKVLFNGIGQGTSIQVMSLQTKRYGNITLYRHPKNHNFYEENGYTPAVGQFRRFPVAGKIEVSSPFNPNRYHPIRRKIRPHNGVDFRMRVGTPIYAPADGVVSHAGFMRGGGYTIVINHAGGYSTVYMHLSKMDVKKGQSVALGQVIAKSGNTGYSTGAHLHYEVHVNGKPRDPLKVELPSGNPSNAKKLREEFKRTVNVLKTEFRRNVLAHN